MTCSERGKSEKKRDTSCGEVVETEEVRAVGTGVFSETGRSGERSGVGGFGVTND